MLSKANRKKLLKVLLESEEIKTTYENYIVQDIPFETWVEDTMDRLWVKAVVNDHLKNYDARR